MEPFGEIGSNFSLQLSSRTQFAKISNKKVIAENQCEKHKHYSLVYCNNETKQYSGKYRRFFIKIKGSSFE